MGSEWDQSLHYSDLIILTGLHIGAFVIGLPITILVIVAVITVLVESIRWLWERFLNILEGVKEKVTTFFIKQKQKKYLVYLNPLDKEIKSYSSLLSSLDKRLAFMREVLLNTPYNHKTQKELKSVLNNIQVVRGYCSFREKDLNVEREQLWKVENLRKPQSEWENEMTFWNGRSQTLENISKSLCKGLDDYRSLREWGHCLRKTTPVSFDPIRQELDTVKTWLKEKEKNK